MINDIDIVIQDIKAGTLALYKPLKLSETKKKNLDNIRKLTFHHLIL